MIEGRHNVNIVAIEYLAPAQNGTCASRYVPEFHFSPSKGKRIRRRWGACEHEECQPVQPHLGPMVPPTISNPRPRAAQTPGKADPTWDTAFSLKYCKPIPVDAPLRTPKGTMAEAIAQNQQDERTELAWLISTQHLELATIRQTLLANGIGSTALDRDESDIELAESDVATTHYSPDPAYASAMSNRIEYERYLWACGPVHRTRFAITRDRQLGIEYLGRDRTPELVAQHRRDLKNAFPVLPTVEDVEDGRAFSDHYHGKAVLARMTDAEYAQHQASRRYGAEDPDPFRVGLHADNMRLRVLEVDPDEPEALLTTDLPGGIIDVGYAGPSGLLGLDDTFEDAEQVGDWM